MTDTVLFLKAWIGAPLRVASVVPSGPRLAHLITARIGPDTGPVLELGPGTGVFTRALLKAGVAERNLTLIEAEDSFADLLSLRFPQARLYRMYAGGLRHLPPASRQHGAAISGLPLLSMPQSQVLRVLAGVFAQLRPGAALWQFTYGPRCPVPARIRTGLGLRTQRAGHTLRNFPPATVWQITQEPPHIGRPRPRNG